MKMNKKKAEEVDNLKPLKTTSYKVLADFKLFFPAFLGKEKKKSLFSCNLILF